MVFDDVLLLPKPCSTRKAPRRSDGLSPRGTCTTPESLSPAEGKVTACSVMGVACVPDVSFVSQWRRVLGVLPSPLWGGVGGGGGRGEILPQLAPPLSYLRTPTPPACAALRRATLPTRGRVKTEFAARSVQALARP